MNNIYVLVMHRDEVQRTVLAVDVRNEFRNLTLELGRVCQRGRSDLDKDNVPNPLWVIVEELLEGTELYMQSLLAQEKDKEEDLLTFWTTPFTTSNLSRPTIIFLPS